MNLTKKVCVCVYNKKKNQLRHVVFKNVYGVEILIEI